jgi:hypothetical protein
MKKYAEYNKTDILNKNSNDVTNVNNIYEVKNTSKELSLVISWQYAIHLNIAINAVNIATIVNTVLKSYLYSKVGSSFL